MKVPQTCKSCSSKLHEYSMCRLCSSKNFFLLSKNPNCVFNKVKFRGLKRHTHAANIKHSIFHSLAVSCYKLQFLLSWTSLNLAIQGRFCDQCRVNVPGEFSHAGCVRGDLRPPGCPAVARCSEEQKRTNITCNQQLWGRHVSHWRSLRVHGGLVTTVYDALQSVFSGSLFFFFNRRC